MEKPNKPTTIDPIEPTVRETAWGWMAISPPATPFCLGVTGHSEWEVREKFQCAAERWSVVLSDNNLENVW